MKESQCSFMDACYIILIILAVAVTLCCFGSCVRRELNERIDRVESRASIAMATANDMSVYSLTNCIMLTAELMDRVTSLESRPVCKGHSQGWYSDPMPMYTYTNLLYRGEPMFVFTNGGLRCLTNWFHYSNNLVDCGATGP